MGVGRTPKRGPRICKHGLSRETTGATYDAMGGLESTAGPNTLMKAVLSATSTS